MKSLRHFQVIEFNDAAHMDEEFLDYLDEVRERAGVPFRLTSDYRDPERNAAAGGEARSLHVLGRAVDFTVKRWEPDVLDQVAAAVYLTPRPNNCGREFEIVQSERDRHFHLGLFPDGRPSRLLLKLD